MSIFERTLLKLEMTSRKINQIELKMEIFKAGNPRVLDAQVPIASNNLGYIDKNLFVSAYIRVIYKNGVSRFIWFHDFTNAEEEAKKMGAMDNIQKVIGPHLLPKSKYERFE